MKDLFNLDKINFSYDKKRVIKNISLTLESGHFYGIMGPNGCGKTTFLDLLISHRRSETGEILYKKKAISSYSKRDLSKEIALVPQNFYINFPFTAKEVVMMGRYPHIDRFSPPGPRDLEIVTDVMDKTETMAFSNRFVTQLSGGERQRVIFARALAQDSPVLVLDEATSNLDINHTLGLLNLLSKKVDSLGKTVIAVMQDINLVAEFCDHIIFMSNGRILFDGPREQILTDKNLKAVFQVDSKVYFEPYCESLQVVFKRK